MEDVLGDYKSFVSNILVRVKNSGLDISNYSIDHIAYRVETQEQYDEMRPKLMKLSSSYIENIHNNRPISTFVLKEPLSVEDYEIPLIELPSPKEGHLYKRGMEHIEFVVGNDIRRLEDEYSDLWTNKKNEGEFNKTLIKTFEDGTTAKFHERPLDEVLRLEGKEFIDVK